MALRLAGLCLLAIPLGLYLGPYRDRAQAERDAYAGIASAISGRAVSINCPGTFERLTEVSPRRVGSVHGGRQTGRRRRPVRADLHAPCGDRRACRRQ
jgi:hypothetical protein